MPKKVLNILQFHGGISDDADPRDIEDNQFAELENVAVDEVGKIIVLGDIKTTHYTIAGAIGTPGGQGLLTIRTDYDKFPTNADSASGAVTAAPTPKLYYLVHKIDGTPANSGINIDSDGEGDDILTVANLDEASMYWVKGALRVYEANLQKAGLVTPKWRGFIKGVLYGTDSGDAGRFGGHVYNSGGSAINQWYTQDAPIKGCFPKIVANISESIKVTVGHNLIMGNHVDTLGGLDLTNATPTALFAFANEACGTGIGPNDPPTDMATASAMYWGLGMGFNEGNPGSGTWANDGDESYQFYCSTIYDGNQESELQLFTMYPSGYQAKLQDSANYHHGPWSDTATDNYYKDATPETNIIFAEGDDNDARAGADGNGGVSVAFSPTIKWCHPAHDDETADSSYIYNFGASTVGAQSGGNPRITGLKCYWASSEDGFSDKWELWEWNFEKGLKVVSGAGGGVGSYALTDWTSPHNKTLDSPDVHYYHHAHAGPLTASGVHSSGFVLEDPPKIVRYVDNNGHDSEEILEVQGFKCSVLAGGRIWIGNVKIDSVTYGDAMIKSKVGQYDKFPTETNRLDVISNDGDDIIALSEFADRILQFKENVLYILNVSGEYVGLEAKHSYKGVTNPGAVCRTDYGVAWANTVGCYVYDGNKVINLLEEGGVRKINKSTWLDHIAKSDNNNGFHRVGFNPIKRQIIVTAGADDEAAAYIYDMVTKAWTYSTSLISDPNTGSNFINDLDTGDLLIHDAAGTIDRWADTPTGVTDTPIKILTKDFDFGQPSIRKKIYKVYVTYQGHGGKITINYGTNGGDCTGQFFITDGTGASTGANAADACLVNSDTGEDDWVKAELKPSSSINNINSFQLLFDGLTTDTDFAINDISIVYRMKNIK